MRAFVTITVAALTVGCLAPPGEERLVNELDVQECEGTAAVKYDDCLANCNQDLSTETGKQQVCQTGADDALLAAFRDLAARVRTRTDKPFRDEMRQAFRNEVVKWERSTAGCSDETTAAQQTREDCAGGNGLLGLNPGGCRRVQRDAYNECLGKCPGERSLGTVCSPASAELPTWAECGTYQRSTVSSGPLYTGTANQCFCASDERRNQSFAYCSEMKAALRDPRYRTACSTSHPDAMLTPRVNRSDLGVPVALPGSTNFIDWKCVLWVDNSPDWASEARVNTVAPATPAPSPAPDALPEDEGLDPAAPGPAPTPAASACGCDQTIKLSDSRTCDCPNSWRVVHVDDWGADVSQVCRNGRWLTFNWYPRDEAQCCAGNFQSCCQRTDAALGCQ